MKEMNEFRAVIWDLDGTIYDSTGIKRWFAFRYVQQRQVLQALLASRGQICGIDFKSGSQLKNELYQGIASRCSWSAEQVAEWYENEFYAGFLEILSSRSARPGLERICEFFQNQGIAQCVLSDYGQVEERLHCLGMNTSYFTFLRSCEEEGALKPHPRTFQDIAHDLKIDPEQILVVGDTPSKDGEGARSAGMHFFQIDKDSEEGFKSPPWEGLLKELELC